RPSEPSHLSLHDALPICQLVRHTAADRAAHKRIGRIIERADAISLAKKTCLHRPVGQTPAKQDRRVIKVESDSAHLTQCVGYEQDRKSTRLNSSHVKRSY